MLVVFALRTRHNMREPVPRFRTDPLIEQLQTRIAQMETNYHPNKSDVAVSP